MKERNLRQHQFTHMNASEQAAALASGFTRYGILKKEPTLSCRICGKMFSKTTALRRHEVIHVASKFRRDFQCPHCPKAYTNEQSRKEHVVAVHESLNARRKLCKICGESVIWINFRTHMEHHGNFRCKNCDKRFTTGKSQRLHEAKCGKPRRKRESDVWDCDICGKFYPTREYMLRHRRTYHKEHWKGAVPVKLAADVSVQDPREEEFLEDLNKEGIQHVEGELYSYQMYELDRLEGGGYRCRTCSVEISGSGGGEVELEVMEHVRTMHMGNFRCNNCTKRFKNLFEAEVHQKLEHAKPTRSGRMDCEICGKKAMAGKHIKKHEWSHKSLWEVAEAVNRGETVPGSYDCGEVVEVFREFGVEVNLKCVICGREGFGGAKELFEHRRTEHPDAKRTYVQRKKDPKKRGRRPGEKEGKRKKGGEGCSKRKGRIIVRVIADEDSENEAMEEEEEEAVVIKEERMTPENSSEEEEDGGGIWSSGESDGEFRSFSKRIKCDGVVKEEDGGTAGGGRRSLRSRASLRKPLYEDDGDSEEDE